MKIIFFFVLSRVLEAVYSDCPPDTANFKIILSADMKKLASLFSQPSYSDNSGSRKTFYSREPIKCTKDSDCSKQGCCGQKTVQCNKDSGSCGCYDSSKKEYGTRPIIFIQNTGTCGLGGAGCTICMDGGNNSKTQRIVNDVADAETSWNALPNAKSNVTNLRNGIYDFAVRLATDSATITEYVNAHVYQTLKLPVVWTSEYIRVSTSSLKEALGVICEL